MATTPPPPSNLRTPPTPRHGAGYDQYEPYSTRHSARLAGQRASREPRTTTPPPPGSSRSAKKQQQQQVDVEIGSLSPPGSIHCSPRKKQPGRNRAFVANHSLESNTTGVDTSDPFISHERSHTFLPSHPTTTLIDGMLPTPAKTPKKKTVGDPESTARSLFHPSSMSGRSKKAKKQTGFSLDSFSDDPSQAQSKIEIYTDCRDRIPELDESETNPFYQKLNEGEAAPAPRTSTRRRVGEGKRDKEVDEAIDREDGMFYVFRGKKTFRKFGDAGDVDEEDDDDLGLLAGRPDLLDSNLSTNVRALTRSSIKPRVLFPSATDRDRSSVQDRPTSDAEEEAATDIEDHVLSKDVAIDVEHAPRVEQRERDRLVTPPLNTHVATPASPGATTRSLRPRIKREGLEPDTTPTSSDTKKKRVSPFDGWMRKKPSPDVAGSKAKKRDADLVASPGGPATKRTRGNRATTS